MNLLLTGQETKRLRFEKVSLEHFAAWLEFFKDPTASIHWVAETKSPEEACEDWYQNQFNRYATNRGGMNALIEKHSGVLIGHCGLLVQTVDGIEELEIAYSLLPQFWNQGLATEAALKCKQFAIENKLATSLISIISLTNAPSANVAQKLGMSISKQSVYKGNPVNIFRITI